jgi:cell division protein ZapA
MAEGLVPVQIFGQRYPIRSALDPQYVQELASYVDERMRAAADQSPAGDSLRLAVLAALNIADEAFRTLDAEDGRPASLSARLAGIERIIDEALASEPGPGPALLDPPQPPF